MQMLQPKDHFILNQNHNQINFLGRAILFLLLAFIHFEVKAEQTFKLAIIDTGFCQQKIANKNINLMPSFDATSSISSLKCDDSNINLPRFHGQKVLETFSKNYHADQKINIIPIIVYDNRAETSEFYWNKAIEFINSQTFDYVISAVGIKSNSLRLVEGYRPIWFLAAARISPSIKINDSIFPQNQFKLKNIYLFGSFDQMGFVDCGQLNLSEIDLFTKDIDKNFYGSSYAVGKIAGLLLSNQKDKNFQLKKIPETFILKDSR